jgi:hypothetical protein
MKETIQECDCWTSECDMGRQSTLVKRKGRPEIEKSWENKWTISRVRIRESARWAEDFLQW